MIYVAQGCKEFAVCRVLHNLGGYDAMLFHPANETPRHQRRARICVIRKADTGELLRSHIDSVLLSRATTDCLQDLKSADIHADDRSVYIPGTK